jgi:hypothetical protein
MEKNTNMVDKKAIKMHKESFFMYEKTKKECKERLSEAMNPDGSKRYDQEYIDEKLKQIQDMQDEVKVKYLMAGGNPDELVEQAKPTEKKTKTKPVELKTAKKTPEPKQRTPIIKKEKKNNMVETESTKNEAIEPKKISSDIKEIPVVPENWDKMDFTESFDVIPLPSKGQCYEGNMSTIAVSYLTANDENMIVSPNLYRDGLILDYLLKAKIKNKNIDPDDLLEGDREAIILWLRATGYGTQYPITVTDNKTGIEFDTILDLTQIKHKPFVLEGDENGYFNYTLPVSKDEVKFRFLTHGDIKQIEEIENEELVNVKKERLISIATEINSFLENETVLNKDEKLKLYEAKRSINKWAEKLDADEELGYTHKLTNRLELSIISINGETDREYIAEYVRNMNVRDALAIRRYITENEPGLDYAVTVERPESLGGGSMPVFLSLDEYVFLNIA